MAREHLISAGSAHPGASFRVAVASTAAGQRDVTFVEKHGQVVTALLTGPLLPAFFTTGPPTP